MRTENANEEHIDLGDGSIFIGGRSRTKPYTGSNNFKIPEEDLNEFADDIKILKAWAERSHHAKNERFS